MAKSSAHLNRMKADVLGAMAHPVRLAILDCLKRGDEVCVCNIADAVGSERSNVSRHLAVMVKAGILSARKQGLWVYYRLCCPCVLKFLGCIEEVIRQQHKDLAAALSRK
jgi:DNA-binding transcriptional ArsR family regulator